MISTTTNHHIINEKKKATKLPHMVVFPMYIYFDDINTFMVNKIKETLTFNKSE